MDLESAHPWKRPCRRANLGREVGEGRQVVSVQCHRVRELASGDLHAVAGVAAEADDGFVDYFTLALANLWFRYCAHKSLRFPIASRAVPAAWESCSIWPRRL